MSSQQQAAPFNSKIELTAKSQSSFFSIKFPTIARLSKDPHWLQLQ
jgi:hypothetical protein